MKTSVIAAVWIGVVATVPAWASSGTMSGTFQFTQRQENCGNGVNAKYPCGQYNTQRPVRNSRVEIRRASDNALLGAGTTNNLGGFNVAWTDSSASGNVSVLVWWRSQQADDRYRMTDAAGGLYYFWVPAQTAVNGANTGIGTWTWGTNNLANVWDGANMMWYYSLSQTNRMNAFFGTITPAGAGATRYVEIRAFVDDGSCPTGSANGTLNRVCLPSAAWNMNQSRVMHEMGHIAEYLSNRDQARTLDFASGIYDFGGNAGWSQNSAEHYSAQFWESIATAMATVGLYSSNAAQPRSCISAAACTGFDLEVTPANCTNEVRWPISAERYFWDVYDTANDGETLAQGVWHLTDTLHAFDPGTDNRQRDETWNGSFSSLDDLEGHSTLDFMENWKTWGTDSEAVLNRNCRPSGGSPAVD